MSSYNFSESHNFQTVLWDVVAAIVGLRRILSAIVGDLRTVKADLAAWLLCSAKCFAVTSAMIAGLTIVALVLSNPSFLIGLFITGLFAVVTMPRKQVCK